MSTVMLLTNQVNKITYSMHTTTKNICTWETDEVCILLVLAQESSMGISSSKIKQVIKEYFRRFFN